MKQEQQSSATTEREAIEAKAAADLDEKLRDSEAQLRREMEEWMLEERARAQRVGFVVLLASAVACGALVAGALHWLGWI